MSIFVKAQIPLRGCVSVHNSGYEDNGNIQFVDCAVARYKLFQSLPSNTKGIFDIGIDKQYSKNGQVWLKILLPENYITYEVVNQFEIDNITLGRTDTVQISICPKGKLNERRAEMVDIPIKKIEQDYLNKITTLQNEKKLSAKQLSDTIEILKKELIKKQEEIQYIAEQLLYVNLDFQSEQYKKAYVFFEKAEYDSVFLYLPSETEIEKQIAQSDLWVNSLLLKARTSRAFGNTNNAISEYELTFRRLANERQKDIFFVAMELSKYYYMLGKYNESMEFAQKALKAEINNIYKIDTYNLIGQIQENQKNKSRANKNYKSAIILYKQLQKDSLESSTANKYVAQSYYYLANHYNKKKQYQKAENNYKKALEIYIRMCTKGEKDTENQIKMLQDFALCFAKQHKTNLIEQCIDRIELLKKDIHFSEEQQAEFYFKQGYLDFFQEKYSSFKTAYYLYSILYQKKPHLYEKKVIVSALNTAIVQHYYQEYDSAIKYCKLIDTLSDKLNSNFYLKEKAFCYALLGSSYEMNSQKCFKDAKKIAKKPKKIKKDELLRFIKYVKNGSNSVFVNAYIKKNKDNEIKKTINLALFAKQYETESPHWFEKADSISMVINDKDLSKMISKLKHEKVNLFTREKGWLTLSMASGVVFYLGFLFYIL